MFYLTSAETSSAMSQHTPTTESGGSSQLPGEGSDTLDSLSGETELKVTVRRPGTETNNIKLLINEVKGLHEQRLRCLELDTNVTQEELLQVS